MMKLLQIPHQIFKMHKENIRAYLNNALFKYDWRIYLPKMTKTYITVLKLRTIMMCHIHLIMHKNANIQSMNLSYSQKS